MDGGQFTTRVNPGCTFSDYLMVHQSKYTQYGNLEIRGVGVTTPRFFI